MSGDTNLAHGASFLSTILRMVEHACAETLNSCGRYGGVIGDAELRLEERLAASPTTNTPLARRIEQADSICVSVASK
jgi:hypothetical protein